MKFPLIEIGDQGQLSAISDQRAVEQALTLSTRRRYFELRVQSPHTQVGNGGQQPAVSWERLAAGPVWLKNYFVEGLDQPAYR